MRHDSTKHTPKTPEPTFSSLCHATCPHCGRPLALEDLESGPQLSHDVVHALLDRFLSIECELQQIRRLLIEEVLP